MENIHHSYLIVKNGFATVSTEIRQSLFFPPIMASSMETNILKKNIAIKLHTSNDKGKTLYLSISVN